MRILRSEGLEAAYNRGETDEFVLPTAVLGDGIKPLPLIQKILWCS